MSEIDDRREAFAQRLASYAQDASLAISQGGDMRMRVPPEFMEDMAAAAAVVLKLVVPRPSPDKGEEVERVRRAISEQIQHRGIIAGSVAEELALAAIAALSNRPAVSDTWAEDNEDKILQALQRSGFDTNIIRTLTYTRRKDGIDIETPTLGLKRFVQEIRGATNA